RIAVWTGGTRDTRPYSGGQSHQRQPLLSTCTMPLMTRRSSARSTPRTSVGNCGSIRAHCSSLSQNSFLLINLPPNTNHHRIVGADGLMSSDPSKPTYYRHRAASKHFYSRLL